MIHRPIHRSRAVWCWFAAMVAAAVIGWLLLWRAGGPTGKSTPGVYLVATEGPISVRIGFRLRQVQTTLMVPAGKTFALKGGVQVDALFPDGHRQHFSGPVHLTLASAKVVDGTFFNNPLIQILDTHFAPAGNSTLTDPAAATIRITSPCGVTRFLNPVIWWQAKDELRYDVAVVDLGDQRAPPRSLPGMRPPVAVTSLQSTLPPQLAADRLYGVLVRLSADQTAVGSSRFLTTPDAAVGELPSDPAKLLEEAFSALTTEPARIGDAWLALSRLPPAWRSTELALRLRLKAATELNLPDEFAAAKDEAKRLVRR